MLSCCRILRLAANKSLRSPSVSGVFGFTSTPILVALGTSWRSKPSRFAPNSLTMAARPVKTSDKALPNRVTSGDEDDWYCRGCCPGRDRRWVVRNNHGHRLANQVSRKLRQSITTTFRKAQFNRDVLTLSTKPASLKPWRNAVTNEVESASDVLRRNPITGIAPCCARAASGQAAAAPVKKVTNSRRLMASLTPRNTIGYEKEYHTFRLRIVPFDGSSATTHTNHLVDSGKQHPRHVICG